MSDVNMRLRRLEKDAEKNRRIEELEAALRRIDKLDISRLDRTTQFLITSNIDRALGDVA